MTAWNPVRYLLQAENVRRAKGILTPRTVCGPCRRRSSSAQSLCSWSSSSRLSGGYIRQLQDRIAELENGRSQSANSIQESNAGFSNGDEGDEGHFAHGGAGAEPTDANRDDISSSHTRPPAHPHTSEPSPVYTVIGPVASEENHEGYFGSSSAGTFMQNITAMVEHRLRGSANTPRQFLHQPEGQRMKSFFPPSDGRKPEDEEITLPLRRTADELMHVYWEVLHPTYPVLDPEKIRNEYESLWTNEYDIPDQRQMMCLVNAMFAIAAQLSPNTPSAGRSRIGAQYYHRARSLLDVFEKGSLRTVQALLLLSMYTLSSSDAHQCWILIGLAIRMAQGLGLHLCDSSERAPDPRTRELLRRVWHGCVLLDQIVASKQIDGQKGSLEACVYRLQFHPA